MALVIDDLGRSVEELPPLASFGIALRAAPGAVRGEQQHGIRPFGEEGPMATILAESVGYRVARERPRRRAAGFLDGVPTPKDPGTVPAVPTFRTA